MKFKYIFVVVVIALICGSIYIVYENNHKKKQSVSDDTYIDEEIKNLDIVENMKIGISNFDTMNPLATNNDEIINIDKIVFEPLVNITADFHVEPCLAKDVKRIDETHYEITLDKESKWADGTAFIAEDVKYSIDRIKEGNSIYKSMVEQIESTEVLNDETIKLNLSSPVKFIEYNLNFPIVSSRYYEGEDFYSSAKIPLGTGMYRISSIDERNILLVRNDRWHCRDGVIPRTKTITVIKYGSAGEIFNTFKLNNLDIINTNIHNYQDYIGTMGYNRREYKGRNYEFISINCNDAIMSDVHIRKACNLAINRNYIVQNVLGNTKMVSKTPLDYGSYMNYEDNIPDYNIDNSKKELANAGWSFDGDKWTKDGNELVITLTCRNDDGERMAAAEAVKTNLADAGIKVNVQYVNADRYYQYLNEKDYQMIMTGITNSLNPDLSFFYGDGNIANYNNQGIKDYINDLSNYQSIQKAANEEVPYIGLYRNKCYMIFNANVGGKIASNCFNMFTNFNTWYRQQ